MKYLHLVWAALLRRKVRTILTLLSVLIAFLLFGLLDTIRATFANAGQTDAGQKRLLVTSKMGFSRPLPYSLLASIQKFPGVVGVDYASYVGGTYRDPKNFVTVEAHPDTFYKLYPEVQVSPADLAALRRTRTGVLAGEVLAKQYGWKVGDKIPLRTQQPQKDGATIWTFDVVGILRWIDPHMKTYERQLFGNWDYVEQARQADTGTVTYYSVGLRSRSDVERVVHAIDTMTANSTYETKSQTENAWAAAQFRQMADVGPIATSIMGAVFFTLLLLTAHTMTQAVNERVPEIAILKTIGFSGSGILGLVLSEAFALILAGATIGLAVVTVIMCAAPLLASDVLQVSVLPVGIDIWAHGLLLAAVIAFLIGIPPAMRGMRLRVVDALSGR